MSNNIKVKYDTPIKVTPKQYALIMYGLSGCCAGNDTTLEVKLLDLRYRKQVEKIINS